MGKYILVNLKLAKSMEKGYYFMRKIKQNMMVILLKEYMKDMENFIILKEVIIQDNSKMEKCGQGKEYDTDGKLIYEGNYINGTRDNCFNY